MKVDPFLSELNKNWEKIKPELLKKAETSVFIRTDILFKPDYTFSINKKPGIYLFFIKPKEDLTYEDFITRWKGAAQKMHSGRINKKKIKVLEKDKWHPLYIGKSEELLSRVTEHCFQPIDKTTYSLKMSHRKEIIEVADFSFGSYELNMTESFPNYLFQFLLVNIERELRARHKPLIGKQ